MSNKEVIIDYLSATAGMFSMEGKDERLIVKDLKEIMAEYFKVEIFEIEECKYATNNFKYQYEIAGCITLRFGGPINDFGEPTWQVEMKGEGCREFERRRPDQTWRDFFIFLIGLNMRFKRLDVTSDDKEGKEINIVDLYEKSRKRQYVSIFKAKPTYHGVPEDGVTIDFGSRTSMTELCIYDKKKQQENMGNHVDTDYWARYELRFRQQKAEAVVLDLLKNYENKDIPIYEFDLQAFAAKALYAAIDFKEDNNYDEHDQTKVNTDPRWKAFVGDIERGKLPSPELRKSTYESAYNYIMPKAKNILLTWLIECNYDHKLFLYRIITELKHLSKELTIKQQQRINQYLHETCFNKILTNKDFDDMRMRLFEIEDDLTLPF